MLSEASQGTSLGTSPLVPGMHLREEQPLLAPGGSVGMWDGDGKLRDWLSPETPANPITGLPVALPHSAQFNPASAALCFACSPQQRRG